MKKTANFGKGRMPQGLNPERRVRDEIVCMSGRREKTVKGYGNEA